MSTLWHGRFEGGPASELLAFTVSLDVDRRLAADDLAGSRAHVRGLARVGILGDDESGVVLAALDRVEDELRTGTFAFEPTDEDIHTAIERRVTALAGPAGAKLHTGRSRNDQVATDLRLWTRRELGEIARRVVTLQRTLLDRAGDAGPAYLPGYTHLQRAQPVTLAHHLLAHGWALARDVDRLLDCRRRLDVSPLGAGALAGSSLPLDPAFTVAELARGKAGRLVGNLTGLLATLKGLPLSYNRDLQEDKEPLFDSVDQVVLALSALTGLYRTLQFNAGPMRAAADSPYLA